MEEWVADGVALTTTSDFAMPADMNAVAAMLKANKKGARLNAGTNFKFLGKKMAYHTYPGDGMSYGVISYELADGSGLWLHDFDPANPALRTVKITTVVDAMPKVREKNAHICFLIFVHNASLSSRFLFFRGCVTVAESFFQDWCTPLGFILFLHKQVMAHPVDLIMAWDPALKKWLNYYADPAKGNDRYHGVSARA